MMPIQDQTTYLPSSIINFESSNTTVDFSGQSSRLLMLEEMGIQSKLLLTNGTEVNQSVLTQMYSNSNNAFEYHLKYIR
jgi:Tol biopolymer transport system component